MNNTTICAPATPAGGALAIVRVDGINAMECVGIATKLNLIEAKGNTIKIAKITDKEGGDIDDVVLSIFRAPHSYTGNDAVEISCHGSDYVIKKIIERLQETGCAMAKPGEFTMRAFLNGKMDLAQAEAVADLIAAHNKKTHQMAMNQMRGQFSDSLTKLREKLLKTSEFIELELDFSDEHRMEIVDRTVFKELCLRVDHTLNEMINSYKTGKMIKEGVPVAIVGKTNVGKSTLLNKLVGDDKAIVSNIHGTTRDTIEGTLDIGGITFRLIDTAGLRTTNDPVEIMGIERTKKAIKEATAVVWVLDSQPTPKEVEEMEKIRDLKDVVIVENKIDRGGRQIGKVGHWRPLRISAKEGWELDKLKKNIWRTSGAAQLADDDIVVASLRHYEALNRAKQAIQEVINALNKQLPADMISEHLKDCIAALNDITGNNITTEEVLENIFSHFCVGK